MDTRRCNRCLVTRPLEEFKKATTHKVFKMCALCRGKRNGSIPYKQIHAVTLQECQKLAEARGGHCLSERYVNCKTLMQWRCTVGHEWDARYAWIKHQGHWCEVCADDKRRGSTVEKCQLFAATRGWTLESKEYKRGDAAMYWRCDQGHAVCAKYDVIRRMTPCPQCEVISAPEQATREILQDILGFELPPAAPDWLKGSKLRLDGYNDDNMVAFEYQGIHHYEEVKYMIPSSTLADRQDRDKKKSDLCDEHGCILLVIDGRRFHPKNIDALRAECLRLCKQQALV